MKWMCLEPWKEGSKNIGNAVFQFFFLLGYGSRNDYDTIQAKRDCRQRGNSEGGLQSLWTTDGVTLEMLLRGSVSPPQMLNCWLWVYSSFCCTSTSQKSVDWLLFCFISLSIYKNNLYWSNRISLCGFVKLIELSWAERIEKATEPWITDRSTSSQRSTGRRLLNTAVLKILTSRLNWMITQGQSFLRLHLLY